MWQRFIVLLNLLRFKVRGVVHGSSMRIRGFVGLELMKGGRMSIGDGFVCSSGNMSNPMGRNVRSFFRIHPGAELRIGNNVGISSSCLWCRERIVIEDNVKIGAMCIITDTDCHAMDPVLRADVATDAANAAHAPVTIKENAFIGASSLIGKGVTIGRNSVVGMGSVVTRDIPDNQVWAGNPAKFIREITA